MPDEIRFIIFSRIVFLRLFEKSYEKSNKSIAKTDKMVYNKIKKRRAIYGVII